MGPAVCVRYANSTQRDCGWMQAAPGPPLLNIQPLLTVFHSKRNPRRHNNPHRDHQRTAVIVGASDNIRSTWYVLFFLFFFFPFSISGATTSVRTSDPGRRKVSVPRLLHSFFTAMLMHMTHHTFPSPVQCVPPRRPTCGFCSRPTPSSASARTPSSRVATSQNCDVKHGGRKAGAAIGACALLLLTSRKLTATADSTCCRNGCT